MSLPHLIVVLLVADQAASEKHTTQSPETSTQIETADRDSQHGRPSFVGPTLDPINGSRTLPRDREWLPQARQLSNLADFWFVEVENMQISGGGIATFDPHTTSAHGRSSTLTNHIWNGVDITDPARPGEPLMDLPYFAWDEIRYQSLNTTRPGYHVRIDPVRDDTLYGRLSGGGAVNGGLLFIPDGFFDREPSFVVGANPDLRELDRSLEYEVQGSVRGELGSLRLIAERLDHRHQYPTLISPESGTVIDDEAIRDTFLASGRLELTGLPVDMLLGYQRRQRSHEGAQFRLPRDYTHQADAKSWLIQLGSGFSLDSEWSFSGNLGLATKDEDLRRHGMTPLVADIEEQWFWTARPEPGRELVRRRWSAQAQAMRDHDVWPFTVSLRFTRGSIDEDQRFEGLSATTYRRGVADSNNVNPVSIDVVQRPDHLEEWVQNTRLQIDGQWKTDGRWTFGYGFGLDHSAVGVPGDRTLSFIAPGAGITASWDGEDDSRWFFVLRREPDPLTYQHARFLNPGRDNGTRHRWEDDGDGIPEASEAGALQSRIGGAYHRVSDGLDQSTSNHFAMGWESTRFGAFKAVLTGIARFQLDAMVARLSGPSAGSYRRRLEDDAGGDFRGAERSDGGPDQTPVFDRVPGTNGSELYAIENRDRSNYYVGAELQLVSVERSWWFLNAQAKGYWNVGSAPYGTFPDRNDVGILNESSATPNQRINQRGRLDQDRSFALNIMSGLEPLENLLASVSLRYRDGQPFTRYLVLPATDGVDPSQVDSPSVPVPQMAVWRGGPRHTFHMSLDGRIRYDIPLDTISIALIADGFNILGSATELIEDPRDGDSFRRPLEAVPGRAFLLTLELSIP